MEPSDHKFNNKAAVSYEELVRDPIEEKLLLAKEFEARYGKHEVLRIIEEMSTRYAVERKVKRTREANIRSLTDYARYVQKMNESELSKNSQTFEFIEISDRVLHFKVKECLWAKIYRDLGAPEYGYAFECCTDFPSCRATHPRMRLKRGRTLMMGDDCCDFIYTWDETGTD